MIEFTVPGVPTPKGRPRFRSIFAPEALRDVAREIVSAVKDGAVISRITRMLANLKPITTTYTPAETKAAAEAFAWQSKRYAPRAPLAGALRVDLVFIVPAPTRLDSERSRVWPHVRPDIDNYTKLVYDALNGMFWIDDGQICANTGTKRYGHPPRTEVRISRLSDVDETQIDLWKGFAK